MNLQTTRGKARAICQKHGLDAEVHELVGRRGQIIVEVVDPNKTDRTTIDVPQEVLHQVAVELENEIPGCRVWGLIGGL